MKWFRDIYVEGRRQKAEGRGQEEKAEEFRILKGLTDNVRDLAEDLEYSQSIIGKLDGIYARARFSEAQSCLMPEIGAEFGVELRGARCFINSSS